MSTFDTFWNAYPRKVAKKRAESAWKKLNPDCHLAGRIVGDVIGRRCSEQWTKSGGQFIPHPATYLNGERWLDEDTITMLPPTRRVGSNTSSLDYETAIQVEPAKA